MGADLNLLALKPGPGQRRICERIGAPATSAKGANSSPRNYRCPSALGSKREGVEPLAGFFVETDAPLGAVNRSRPRGLQVVEDGAARVSAWATCGYPFRPVGDSGVPHTSPRYRFPLSRRVRGGLAWWTWGL